MGNNEINIKVLAKDLASGPIGNARASASRLAGVLKTGVVAAAKAAAGAITALVSASSGLAAFGIKNAMDLEQVNISFTTMLGSAEKARQLLSEVAEAAKATPFELPELQNSAKSLLAFGVAQEDIVPTLVKIGDISSGVGMNVAELAEIYGKARVQGRLFGEDVNQLTGRGIPVIQEFAKQFGVTEDQVRKLTEEGKIGFEQLEIAFQNMTGEGGQFFGLMEAQSKSATGVISNLKDGFQQLSLQLVGVDPDGTIKPGGLFDRFKGVLEGLLGFVNENQDAIVEFAQKGVELLITNVQKGVELFRDFIPRLIGFRDNVIAMRDSIVDFSRTAANRFNEFLENPFVQRFIELVKELSGNIVGNLKKSFEEMQPGLETFKQGLKDIAPIVGGLIASFVVGILKITEVVAALAGPVIGFLLESLGNLFINLRSTFDYAVGLAIGAANTFNSVKDTIGNALSAAGDFVVSFWDGVFGFFDSAESTLRSGAENAFGAVQDIAESVFGAISGGVKGAFNNVIEVINGFINTYNGIRGNLNKAPGINLPEVDNIQKLAAGGSFTTNGPQLLMVGDNPGGRERVEVTPMSSPNIRGPKSSSGATQNNYFYGYSREEIERVLEQQLLLAY